MIVTAMRDGWAKRYEPKDRDEAIVLAGVLRDSGRYESVFLEDAGSLLSVKLDDCIQRINKNRLVKYGK